MLNLNSTSREYINHFTIPNNGTILYLNLTWVSYVTPKGYSMNNKTPYRPKNYTYHLELFPSDDTVCIPGNDLKNWTNNETWTGQIKVICMLNSKPNNTQNSTPYRNEAKNYQVMSYQGVGQWALNITYNKFILGCPFPPHYITQWNLTAELEQYYYVIVKA